MSKTLFDKVWDTHVVRRIEGGPDVLFIDRHLIHEVTSPVAFLGLKSRGIRVLYPLRRYAPDITLQPLTSICRLQIHFQPTS